MPTKDPVREEFLEWLLLDKHTKRVYGLPETEKEFADLKGKATRTLRRWKHDPDFQQRLEQRRKQNHWKNVNAAVSPNSRPHKDPRAAAKYEPDDPATPEEAEVEVLAEAGVSVSADPDERDYHLLKRQLRDEAAGGDQRALELYMKWWGGEYARREHAQRESSFTDLSDAELAERVLGLLDPQTVRSWLERQEQPVG